MSVEALPRQVSAVDVVQRKKGRPKLLRPAWFAGAAALVLVATASTVQASPVQASPVQASPVQASPVQASPVQASATASALAAASSARVKAGGSMTVLETAAEQGAWPEGIDPGTDGNGGANQDLEDAVFGSLFELGPSGNTVPDLATGYKILNGGKTWQIDIRHGVEFSDGTPFNAAAVVDNWRRDFKLNQAPTPPWQVSSFTAPSQYVAEINLKTPYSPLLNSMHSRDVNWIASPTALRKQGAKRFAITPVGAGPFTVATDTLSDQLVLKKNPRYWQKGLPYLDQLTFKDANSDESALEAMQAGQAQAYVLMSTLQLVSSFQSGFTVTKEPSTSPLDVQMNTKLAPFNKLVDREALYYATDAGLLAQKLYDGTTKPVQGFTAPGGLFYDPTVPGYRTYDLAKAKALVKQAGGISFTLLAGSTGSQKTLAEALQAEWQAAGMHVTLNLADLPTIIKEFNSAKWQADESSDGAFDPAIGVAQMSRFLSTGEYSGVHDPKLDALLIKATEVPEAQRAAVYRQAAKYESDMAYAVNLFPAPVWNVAAKDVSAPGLTSVHPLVVDVPEIWWQYAGYTS